MDDNAPFIVSKITHEFFEHKRFTGEKIMELPSSSPLNLIKNLWAIVKMKLYESGKQYNSKADLREAIKTNTSETEPAEVEKITKSMDY